jgi:ribosomal protein S18 acetylase RimI-like enzyme
VREVADWLSARGNPQWKHWHSDYGLKLLRERLENDEVYLATREAEPVATLTIQWSDPMVWGEKGEDGLAGYIHAIAITRAVGGLRVGERLLEWAVERIAARGKRYARLDCMAGNEILCRYYQVRGFTPLGTAALLGNWTSRLFERSLV